MGSVDRADYMDNIKVAEVTQAIQKERAIQREYFKAQEKAGKLLVQPPTPACSRLTLKEKVGLPPHLGPILNDPESAMSLTFSRQLWGNAVPGYTVRDGGALASTMKEDFVWDEEEIDLMKQQRFLDKTHNRRRDEHTRYVERRAMYDAMTK